MMTSRETKTCPLALPAPRLVLIVSLFATVLCSAFMYVAERDATQARFGNAIASATDRISTRLELYRSALVGGAAFFAGSDSVTEKDFGRFVRRLGVRERYPGMQGYGWAERSVSRNPGEHDPMSITYLEPHDRRNQAAMGWDMASEPTRAKAMDLARDSGRTALSGRVSLKQEIDSDKQAGFLIYVPVYRTGLKPPTLEERRRDIVGYVYAPFRAGDLFRNIFGSERAQVHFHVYDGSRVDAERLLFESDAAPIDAGGLTSVRHIEHFGREWTIVFQPTHAFAGPPHHSYFVLLAGIVMSLLLYLLTRNLERGRALAEAANRSKAQFLASMSHELRTPLNAITGYADLMDAGVYGQMNPAQRGGLARMVVASKHLLSLIDDILMYARLEAGQTKYTLSDVSCAAVMDNATSLILPLCVEKGIALSTAQGEDRWIYADADKITQVLINLLTNAFKFTEPGGTIEVAVLDAGENIEIAVSDTGIGIPESHLATLFEPFTQVDASHTRTHAGVGLGLSICREYVHAMNGTIRVESELGRGSTFRVYLPKGRQPAVKPGNREAHQARDSSEQHFAKEAAAAA